MRTAIFFIRAKVKSEFFLTQIIRAVHIPKKRQLVAGLGGVIFQLCCVFRQQILMRHRYHRDLTAKHSADLSCAVTSSIHHIITTDGAFFRFDHPFCAFTAYICDRAETDDLGAKLTRALCQRLCQLGRVNITICRVIECPFKIMSLNIRIDFLQLIQCEHFHIHILIPAHIHDPFKFHHPVLAMCQTHRAGYMVIHRIINTITKLTIKCGAIALHIHHRP